MWCGPSSWKSGSLALLDLGFAILYQHKGVAKWYARRKNLPCLWAAVGQSIITDVVLVGDGSPKCSHP
jgi:hypothetical protein